MFLFLCNFLVFEILIIFIIWIGKGMFLVFLVVG